jgi:hypothetical protein
MRHRTPLDRFQECAEEPRLDGRSRSERRAHFVLGRFGLGFGSDDLAAKVDDADELGLRDRPGCRNRLRGGTEWDDFC